MTPSGVAVDCLAPDRGVDFGDGHASVKRDAGYVLSALPPGLERRMLKVQEARFRLGELKLIPTMEALSCV
jgi:hypothetical protein